MFFLFLTLAFSAAASAQSVTLSGYVKDAQTGEDLPGATVVSVATNTGTVTNVYGFYSLSLKPGEHTIRVQSLGYATQVVTLNLTQNVTRSFSLSEERQKLSEVEVTDTRLDDNLKSVEMSVTELSVKEIKKIPQLLGETDVIRTLTLLPGVTTVGEGANGFNVRGGNVDQNLILLDEAPVFNSSHLFGFFSVFNADAVKDVKLYKGGIPAMYGGRLSSVLDVRQKEGNNQRFGAEGGLGLLSSRLLLEGPIIKDKMSFVVGGRRSYQDLFFGFSEEEAIQNSILYFYDLNAKINYRINNKNRIFLSAYFGKDVFGLQELFGFGWGNATATLRYTNIINPKLFANYTLVYSDYTYNLGTLNTSDDEPDFRLDSRIKNYVAKSNFQYFANSKNKIEFGFDATFYEFQPGKITGTIDTTFRFEYAIEPAIYISNEQKVNTRLTLQYGLRYSAFANLGPRNVLLYGPGQPDAENVIGEEFYERGQIVKAYAGWGGLEPRFSANYNLDETQSLKASYNRTRQYIHLISNTTTPTPVDLWRPSGPYIEPATANQVALGYFKNFLDNTVHFSVESFYKSFHNLVDYKDNAQLFQDDIETELLSGIGRAYGLEFMLEKKTGKLTGWISYTLARTERLVEGETRQTTINNGEWYPSNFDKLHDISVVATYTFNDSWDLSANFTFLTGRPITYPTGRGEFEGIPYPIFDNRNGARTPNYHRLDFSANYTPKSQRDKRFKSSWTFGVYNAYARRNPYSVFFRQNPDLPMVTEAVRLSIFGTVVPFITYNFSF